MKRIIFSLILLTIIIVFSIFIYNRYKTRRIEHIIGANQYRLEEYLDYPNDLVKLDSIASDLVEDSMRELIEIMNLRTNKKLLRYTIKGNVRKEVYWLMDQGDGYYVIEAVNTTL